MPELPSKIMDWKRATIAVNILILLVVLAVLGVSIAILASLRRQPSAHSKEAEQSKNEINVQPPQQIDVADIKRYEAYSSALKLYKTSQALSKLKRFTDHCKAERAAPTTRGNHLVSGFVRQLSSLLGVTSSFFSSDTPSAMSMVTPARMADALAYLHFEHGVASLLDCYVDKKWKGNGYELHIGQIQLVNSQSYYEQSVWPLFEEKYRNDTKDLLRRYSSLEGSNSPKTLTASSSKLSILRRLHCGLLSLHNMGHAASRVYMDAAFPTAEQRAALKRDAEGLVKNVLDAFVGMIEQLDWMDDESKEGARAKVANMVAHAAFPELLYNVTRLDAIYSELSIHWETPFHELMVTIKQWKRFEQFKLLDKKRFDRHSDDNGAIVLVNAFYEPSANSITLPAGIMQMPFFDRRHPAALNYGGIGSVVGHELAHGFDNNGVHWNGTGKLEKWMTDGSAANFSLVAQCVVKRIHAAWRAFLAHRELNGPDPLFRDALFSQFNEEQLFFLNFAQGYCAPKTEKDTIVLEILTNAHSLSPYRVLGTLQNFPAFRAAFNCPLGSRYAPKEHCNVWVPFHMAK